MGEAGAPGAGEGGAAAAAGRGEPAAGAPGAGATPQGPRDQLHRPEALLTQDREGAAQLAARANTKEALRSRVYQQDA